MIKEGKRRKNKLGGNSLSFESENTSRYYITIPKDRIGALIGPKGRVQKDA